MISYVGIYTTRVSTLSTEWITVKAQQDYESDREIQEFVSGTQPYLAFTSGDSVYPVEEDWVLAEWYTDTRAGMLCRALVGPDADKTLDPGTYTVWLRMEGNGENKIMRCDLNGEQSLRLIVY